MYNLWNSSSFFFLESISSCSDTSQLFSLNFNNNISNAHCYHFHSSCTLSIILSSFSTFISILSLSCSFLASAHFIQLKYLITYAADCCILVASSNSTFFRFALMIFLSSSELNSSQFSSHSISSSYCIHHTFLFSFCTFFNSFAHSNTHLTSLVDMMLSCHSRHF